MATEDPQSYDSTAPFPSRFPWVFLILVLLLAGVAAFVWHSQRQAQQLAEVSASAGRLTLEQDDGGSLAVVDRTKNAELWYRVTLENAPVGATLALTCDWLDPEGNVVHQNHYTTHNIDNPSWTTHARHRLGPQAPLGTWTVKLSLQGRELRALKFEVRDKLPPANMWDAVDVNAPPKNGVDQKMRGR